MAYSTPDVYVQEISTIPPAVAQVATAIPAFIGYTQTAEANNPGDLKNVPLKIFSMKDYELYYGLPFADPVVVSVIGSAGGIFALAAPPAAPAAPAPNVAPPVVPTPPFAIPPANLQLMTPKYLMYYSVKMFFDNGGGQCYIVSVGSYVAAPAAAPQFFTLGDFAATTPPPGAAPVGLDALALADEPTMIVIPEAVYLTPIDYSNLVQKVLMQCSTLGSRFGIFDICHGTVDLNGLDTVTYLPGPPPAGTTLMEADRGYFGNNNLSWGAAYYPFLLTSFNPYVDANEDNVTVIYTPPPAVPPAVPPVAPVAQPAVTLASLETSNTGLYNFVQGELQNYFLTMPPSGAVAGIYADTDNTRGVWKAPANESLTDVVGPIVNIDNAHQMTLNVDPMTGKSINAIRSFTGKGTLVWGARTLLGNDNEWRYVPVRRLFIMLEQSIKNSIYWAVFEPNDANTWVKVRGMIENFLTEQWREGALAGATTKDAFYVSCGLGTTMDSDDILNGIMNVEIGVAPVRPAEFIVLKFSQKIQVS